MLKNGRTRPAFGDHTSGHVRRSNGGTGARPDAGKAGRELPGDRAYDDPNWAPDPGEAQDAQGRTGRRYRLAREAQALYRMRDSGNPLRAEGLRYVRAEIADLASLGADADWLRRIGQIAEGVREPA